MITTPDGDWTILESSDPVPPAALQPIHRYNRCNRCGLRVWTGDMTTHDRWHESLARMLSRF